ncbi:alpha/beta hydrolase family protein [Ferrimonas balearica]|uniref:alpha/beta hydrolase family protein n=1 Tax=Ferrimonas balearica TaxID=44012 RepID=UPI001C95B494|nr:S9 family peptidase [Ferrimonas balearica]MBY5980194.1 S9 family peptidase [Ferrimonas balearica]
MKPWMLLALMLVSAVGWSAPQEIETFSRNSQFQGVKISPDGGHLAVLMPLEGKNVLAILDAKTMETTYVARFPGNKQVGDYHWVNDERVIIELQYFKGWFEQPMSAGEWFAVNVDGSRARNVFGYQAGSSQTGTRISRGQSTYGYGTIVDLLKGQDDHILISSTPFSRSGNTKPQLLKLNVYTGRTRKADYSPVARGQFLTDHNGEARFVVGVTSEGVNQIFYRKTVDDDWSLFYENDEASWSLMPLAFASDSEVYIQAADDKAVTGVFKLDLESGERTLVFRDKVADPSHYWFSADGRHLYALEVEPDYPEYVFVDKARPEAALLKGLLGALPGNQVRIVSQTEDGKQAVVFAFSDRHPGAYYLYDQSNNSLKLLMQSRPWVDAEKSAEMTPIEFTARDGTLIRGYLTLPAGREAKNLPMVVNPHGGPHGPRDWWGYNSEAQLLADRGIAVLQVNFRGSGGYGSAFQSAGYKRWGSDIQYDIIDATRYVIDQGIADKSRVCIYGASFGGYSALQSAIIEPDMFACSVGFVGIYDLPLMFEEGDTTETEYGLRILDKYLGNDEAQLKAFSPVYHVDKLKAPVLLIHGEEDERAPIEHAERLKAALEAKQHSLQWVVMDKEGHGFYNEDNRTEMYETLLGFLETHLKL